MAEGPLQQSWEARGKVGSSRPDIRPSTAKSTQLIQSEERWRQVILGFNENIFQNRVRSRASCLELAHDVSWCTND